MIPRIQNLEHRPTWQTLLADAVKSTDELLELLEINPAQLENQPLTNDFPLRVPRSFVQRMVKGDVHDPLLRQVLPAAAEAQQTEGYLLDPLDEQHTMPCPGLLHKYRGRALLTVTGACAVHCRYCFRRHFPYSDANPSTDHWDRAVAWLAQHPDITELILSGGDPLALTDERLKSLTDALAGNPHLRTLRFHTRLPVVLPERIDDGLLALLETQTLNVVMVIHCNHPNEINQDVTQALSRLRQAGVILLNQSVLLHGVNDDSATLIRLSEILFSAGVLPYYLHQLDRVQGTAHFEVDDAIANNLMQAVHAALPGYLVPRLVRELPGEPGKVSLRPLQEPGSRRSQQTVTL
jgi:EF-P beta-lysylation protein EpmB